MNIRQLTIFRTVCENESFTRAAEQLFMTQPAVSHVIADLEREAGTRLFERRGKKISLNGRGKLLLEKTMRLLELYEDVESSLPGMEEKAGLRIGSSITIAGFLLPELIQEFEKESARGVPLTVQVDSARNTAKRLREGTVDIALIEGGSYMDDFENFAFSSYPVVPLVSPAYLGEQAAPVIQMEKFASMRLLLREEGSAIRDVLEGAFLQHQLPLNPYWISVNSQTLIQAAKAGLGVAVLPEILAEEELRQGSLLKLEVEGLKLRNENHAAVCRGAYLTGPMRQFLEIVRKTADSQKFYSMFKIY